VCAEGTTQGCTISLRLRCIWCFCWRAVKTMLPFMQEVYFTCIYVQFSVILIIHERSCCRNPRTHPDDRQSHGQCRREGVRSIVSCNYVVTCRVESTCGQRPSCVLRSLLYFFTFYFASPPLLGGGFPPPPPTEARTLSRRPAHLLEIVALNT
jgi:hypothetical protein